MDEQKNAAALTLGFIDKKRKREDENSDIEKQPTIEPTQSDEHSVKPSIEDTIKMCANLKELADTVVRLEIIKSKSANYTGKELAKLILTPNIRSIFITNAHGIRDQFIIISLINSIELCQNFNELINLLKEHKIPIPCTAEKTGYLRVEKACEILSKMQAGEDLRKFIPSAYGLRDKVKKLSKALKVSKNQANNQPHPNN